eukprot:GEMP01008443.1.p1 GENE.GEMP01008443.1~~GEMP01008443.1.p1  ORF type:complete len:1081 (-),score=177.29 GEMP01008443.1:268-3510(-)
MDEWHSRPRPRRSLPRGRDDFRSRRRRRSETPPPRITVTIEEIQSAVESVASYREVLTMYMYQQEHFEELPLALTSVLLPKLVRSALTQKEIADMKQLGDYHRMKNMLHRSVVDILHRCAISRCRRSVWVFSSSNVTRRYFLVCPISELIGGMSLLMQIRDLDVEACGVLVDRAGRHLGDLSGKELSILIDVVNAFAETEDANSFKQLLMELQRSLHQRPWSHHGDSLPKIMYGISMLDPDFPLISDAVGYIANNTISYSPQHMAMVAHLCPAEHRNALLDGLAMRLVQMTSMHGPDVVMFCRLLSGCSGEHVDAAFSFICREVARCCAAWDPTQVASSVIALADQAVNKLWMLEHTMLCRTTIPILVPKAQQLSLRHQCRLMSLANLCELDSMPFLQAAGHRMKTEHIDQDTAKELILACTKSNVLDENILHQAAKLILPASLVSLAEAAEIAWGMAAGQALKPRSFRDMVEPYLDEQVSPSIALHLTEAMCDSHFVNGRVLGAISKFLRTCDPAKNVSLIKSVAVLMRVDAPYCSGSRTPSVSSVDDWDEVMTSLKHPTKGALSAISTRCAKVVAGLPSDDMASLLLSFAFLRQCPESLYSVFANEAKRRLNDVNFTSAALCDLLWAFAILLPKRRKVYQIVYEVFNLAAAQLMQLFQSLTPFEAINALFAYEILRKRGTHPLVPLGSTYQVLLRPIIVHQQTLFDFHYDVLAQALLSWQQNTEEDLGIPFPEGLATEAIKTSQTLVRNQLSWRIDREVGECAREIDWEASAVTSTGLPMAYRHPDRDVCVLVPRPWHYIEHDALDGSMVFLSQLLVSSGFEVYLLSYLKWLALPRRPDSKRNYFLYLIDGNESAVFCHVAEQPEQLKERERRQAAAAAAAAVTASNDATQYHEEHHNASDTAEYYVGGDDDGHGENNDIITPHNPNKRSSARETHRDERRRRRDSDVRGEPVKPRRRALCEDPVRTSSRTGSTRVGRHSAIASDTSRQHGTESALPRYGPRAHSVADEGDLLEQPSTDRRRSRSRARDFATSKQGGDRRRRSRSEAGLDRRQSDSGIGRKREPRWRSQGKEERSRRR